MSDPRIVFSPTSRRSLVDGIDLVVKAIRPSLGPTGRMVAVSRGPNAPEFIDDGATVARRITGIPDPDANMGAMLIRDTLWSVREAVGDGSVTTAVMLQTAVHEGCRMLAAGVEARRLEEGIQWTVHRTAEALRSQVRPLNSRGAVTRFARSVCHDPEIAEMVGEVLDFMGPDGYVQVEETPHRGLDREYVQGSYWRGTCLSRHTTGHTLGGEASVANAAVVASDLSLDDVGDVVRLLDIVRQRGASELFVVARGISASVASVLAVNQQAGTMKTVVVSLAPSAISASALEDVGTLTGSVPLLEAAGDRMSRLTPHHLGHARRAWATDHNVGLTGGGGDSRVLRRHIASLRRRLNAAGGATERELLRARVGRLLGGMATLLVGGNTERDTKRRADMSRRVVASIRSALADGVVPGGGSGFLHAARALRDWPIGCEPGVAVMRRALEAPLRAIAHNGGHDPSLVVARVRQAPEWHGWDALSGDVVDMWQAGIVDPVGQLVTALRAAASVAAVLLTTDVLVHGRRPKAASRP